MKKRIPKKLLTFVLAAVMICSIASIGAAPAVAAEGDTYTFQVLFTSDLHGCFYDWSYSTNSNYTGLARVATKINQLRSGREDDTILIDVGDTIQGNGTTVFHSDATWTDLYPVIAGMEYLGYDAWVLGNHEFNFGIPALEEAYGKDLYGPGQHGFSGAILAGNVFNELDEQVYDSYYIKEFDNGLRVAIVGMTNPNIDQWDMMNLAAAGYYTESATEMTEETIKYLQDNDMADIFIAAEHMDPASEYAREGSGASDVLANEFNAESLELFIGAHGHTNTNTMINGVRFVEVGSNGGRMGQVEITVTEEADGSWAVADKGSADVKMTNIALSQYSDNANFVAPDAGYKTALETAHNFGVANSTTVIGQYIGEPLVPDAEIKGTYEGYLQDTALNHLVNGAMLHYTNEYVLSDEFQDKYPEYAGMEVTLSGSAPLDTNANHKAGSITKGSVSSIYKYDNNTLYLLAMTGEQFKAWMEWSYIFIGPYNGSGYSGFDFGPAMSAGDLTIPYGNGNMPGYCLDHFEGISYKVDLTKPYGERIVDLKDTETGETFDLEKTYLVAVNNYRATTQLIVHAGESDRPAVFPASGDLEPATLLATEIETTYPGTGEGMLGVMINYIQTELNGTIDNTDNGFFTPNWEYILPEINPVYRARAVEGVNNGTISISPVLGNNYAKRAVTAYEVVRIDDFTDVAADAWYYDDIAAIIDAQLVLGTSSTSFSPNTSMTREMFVTLLHRMAGSPSAGDSSFTDVESGRWYSEAIAWAEESDIIQGVGNGRFGLGSKITREQMVTMMYHYLQAFGSTDGVVLSDLSGFRDADKVSGWALEAMQWAVGADIVKGHNNGTLTPASFATRAQASALFVRSMQYLGV